MPDNLLEGAGRRARILACLVSVSALAGLAGIGAASPPGDCASPPPGLVVEPGRSVRLGASAFELAVRPGETDGVVSVDLLARPFDTATRRVRMGGFLPHLAVGYEVTGPDGLVEAGDFQFRVSLRGPSYGADLALASDGLEDLTLSVTVDRRNDAVSPETGSSCPAFPLALVFSLDSDLQADEPAAPLSPADDMRIDFVSNFDPLPSQSSPYSDVWGYSNGSVFLGMLGSVEGTYFVDLTDPANPVEVGFLPGPNSGWRDMKTYQHYAYIVTEGSGTGQGVQIVDLSDPLDPVLVNTWDDTVATVHNLYIDEAIGQAWLVGANSGTRILDLSQDPVNPVEVASRPTPYVHDAFVENNLAYLSQLYEGTHEIVDSTNPSNLESVSEVTTPTSFTHNSWTNHDATILATTDETSPGGHVGIWDITDKAAPVLRSEYNVSDTTLVHNVMFDDDGDDRVAMSYYSLGLRYIDVHTPSIPIELGNYDSYPDNDSGFGGAWGVYAFDPRGYIYLADRYTGLHVLEYVPTGGVLSGRVTDDLTGDPIPNAEIVILPAGVVESADSDGLFGVYLDAGALLVRAGAPGYKTETVSPGAMPLGGRIDVDVSLERLPLVELSGTVRRADTLDGIAGARVAIPATNVAVVTDANGDYTFDEVAVGQKAVTAEAFGFASQEALVVLSAGQTGSLDLLLAPGLFVDDVERDTGWGPGTGIGDAGQGHWVRVDPNGTGGGTVQPEDDHTPFPGTIAFITGQSGPGAGPNANDVEGGATRWTSPPIDLSDVGAARLRYHRWVSNSSGVFQSGKFEMEASSDGVSFLPVETVDTEANNWIRGDFDLGSVVSLTDEVRLRISATSGPFSPALQVLECGVDDVDVVVGCLSRFSPELGDADGDGTVDACDACPFDVADDADGDEFCGDVDNTPFTASPDQADADGDGVGDAADNCVATGNADQRDLDDDGEGDVCDADADGDLLDDSVDPDDDDDGIADASDVCPLVPDGAQLDADDDGEGDACDMNDGVVQGVRLGDEGLIVWEPEDGSDAYNLYQGELGAEILLPLSGCRIADLQTTFYIDPLLPQPGSGWLYLVARVVGGAEDSLGRSSGGVERVIQAPCP